MYQLSTQAAAFLKKCFPDNQAIGWPVSETQRRTLQDENIHRNEFSNLTQNGQIHGIKSSFLFMNFSFISHHRKILKNVRMIGIKSRELVI